MIFVKYSSIENTYREDEISRARCLGIKEYVVTEKLHGSNLGFYFAPGKEMRIASRNGFTDDGFFAMGSSQSIQDLLPNLQEVADDLFSAFQVEQVIIYGELVGDGIQKGVFYSKEKRFYAFRISLVFNDSDIKHLSYGDFSAVCDKSNIPVAPFIFMGSLDDCLKVSNTFDSLVAQVPDNICEGVVIQPIESVQFHTGGEVIFKNKNEKFKEKSSARKEPISLDMDAEFIENAARYLTDNLAESIISKIGRDIKLMPLYMKEFNDEMVREIGAQFNERKIEKKYVTGRFIGIIKPLVMAT